MALEKDDVDKIANLAKLEISDNEADKVRENLSAILELVDQMQAVNTDDITPMAHPLDTTQPLRVDEVTAEDHRDEYQQIAPATENGLYLVPKVIE